VHERGDQSERVRVVGRLPSLIRGLPFLVVLGLASCDGSSSGGASTPRSEQVIASAAPPAATAAPAPTTHAPPPAARRKLCEGDGNAKGRTVPKMTLAHVEASGAPPLDGAMLEAPRTTGSRGPWTWVNFWAAWCGPCKEEMPRLLSWQDKLGKAGTPLRLLFVSLDDDARQLRDFLEHQPAEGVRSSLWLPEGASRTGFLGGLRMKSAPELPEQVLLDPSGRVRCFMEGAVDDGDYAEIAELVARSPNPRE
jgi:thiol-disulfide isomerase/thioredoxin